MTQLRGKFIVLDGGEGCGKSTQAKMLLARLDQDRVPAILVQDPGSTRVGHMIRAMLLNPENTDMDMRCEMLLYMASRAQMMVEKILPALAECKAVISDRFVSSTLAYQLGGAGLTAADIRAVAEVAIKGRWPDLTLIFDLPVEIAAVRLPPKFALAPDDPGSGLDLDRIEQRPSEYHETVRRNYLRQAKDDAARCRVIDATQPVERVHQQVIQAVHNLT